MVAMNKFLLTFLFVASFGLYSQQIHILQKNETLYKLSRQYQVSVNDIMKLNNITNPADLAIGSRILIPGEYNTYSVKKGDNLYRIARMFDIEARSLANMNGIRISDTLYVGQTLRVPQTEESTPTEKEPVHTYPHFYWPHDGKRSELNGKLVGTQIQGKKGDSVVSVSSGRVIWIEPYRGYGKLIIVETDDKTYYVYGGNEENLVQIGQQVSPGTRLGILGQNASEGDAKVYFSVYKNGIPIDTEKAPRK